MRWGILTLLGASLLAGCTAAQMKAAQIRNNNQAALQQLHACAGAAYNAPENAVARSHIPFNALQPSIEQLSDTSYLNDSDKSAVIALHDGYATCRKNVADQLAKATPTLVPILVAAWGKDDDLLVELLQKKLTWGDFTRSVRELSTSTQTQLVAEGQRIDHGLAVENQQELAAQQRAFAAFAQYEQNQQIINSMNRPVFTNCTGNAFVVNCVSH